MAPSITSTGFGFSNAFISVQGGGGGAAASQGSSGQIRIESFNPVQGAQPINFIGPVSFGSPFNVFVNPVAPSVRVTSVDGVSVAVTPMGSFQMPDVTINNTGPVTVLLQANQIPVGTVINLQFYPQSGPFISVNSTPLAGSLASSTATATVTLPSGFSRGLVVASFTQ